MLWAPVIPQANCIVKGTIVKGKVMLRNDESQLEALPSAATSIYPLIMLLESIAARSFKITCSHLLLSQQWP